MKLVNSKGRVLMHVTEAKGFNLGPKGFEEVLYRYTGDGMGGYTDIVGLHRTIAAVKADNPSAKLVGLLPQPQLVDASPRTDDTHYLDEAPKTEADEAAVSWDPFMQRVTTVQ